MELTARTVFVIAIATARMIFPGIEPSTLPAEQQTTPFGAAVKSVTMELTSSAEADAESRAFVTVPKGLGAGSRVSLTIERPRATAAARENPEPGLPGSFEVRQFWGNHENAPAGQPKVTSGAESSVTPEGKTEDGRLPDGSYAHWPGYDTPPLKPHASAAGEYLLDTNYCGGAAVNVAEDQDFLVPIRITSPASEPDLSTPIRIAWEAVPNAVAYLLSASGGGEKWSTVWTSSAAPDLTADIERRPVAPDELRGLIEQRALLPADATSCTIPAGIFKGANSVMLTITAFGRDTVQEKDGVTTAVIVRSTAGAALYSRPYDIGLGTGD